MKKQKTVSQATISTYNTIKKMRGNWGNLNPITKVINNRKHEYEYPDSYYDYDMQEEIENTTDFEEWGEW